MLIKSIIKQLYLTNPLMVFFSLSRNRELVWQLTKREIIGRYRGSVLGLLWSFLNPILMLSVYTFVFGVVFNARWPGSNGGMADFAIILFTGLIVFNIFSECVSRAPTLILNKVNFVKKMVFPLESLPWVTVGTALFQACISITVLVVFYAIIHFSLNWTLILLPIVILPLVFLVLGFMWFLASVGVYMRDVAHVVRILTMMTMFLSAIFFPLSRIPESVRGLVLYFNPVAYIIEQTRLVVVWGQMPDWPSLGIYYVVSIIVAWLGLVWFQITRKGFADVI